MQHVWERRGVYTAFEWGKKLKEENHQEDLEVDERIVNLNLGEIGWWCGLDLSGFGYRPVTDFCEKGNESSASMKFLLWQRNFWRHKNISVPLTYLAP
jgi:hypothetical protein